ncbi:hypothetical protein APB39_29630 [Pseudomonas aeruginosa]|nr:hypothetical protein APB39_29630 [Pseudomonas aeruginosa]
MSPSAAPAAAPGPRRGPPFPAASRFCQGCGGALAPLRCIACNADLAAGAKFCGACGAPQQ